MKQTLALISLSLFTALSVTAQSKSGQDKSTSKAQIVGTAEIVKIDAKKKTLQVRNVAEGNPTTPRPERQDRKSTRLNSSHITISYAVICLKKKKHKQNR